MSEQTEYRVAYRDGGTANDFASSPLTLRDAREHADYLASLDFINVRIEQRTVLPWEPLAAPAVPERPTDG